MREYITRFMKNADWQKEAISSLLSAYDEICSKEPVNSVFCKWISEYESGGMMNGEKYGAMLEEIADSAEKCGINTYQAQLLIFVCFTRALKSFYDERGISGRIFDDSMLDLRCKLYECHSMYGVWGSFVAGWFPGFFYLDRFALGRLQFEKIKAAFNYTDGSGRSVSEGDAVLNVHIPSLGKLQREDVDSSFSKAADFYSECFKNDYAVFVCHSWLLFQKHREMLPAGSNIIAFMDHFTVLHENSQQLPGDMWRVFYSGYTENFQALPRKTALQSAYVDYLCGGGLPGEAFGIFFLQSENDERNILKSCN